MFDKFVYSLKFNLFKPLCLQLSISADYYLFSMHFKIEVKIILISLNFANLFQRKSTDDELTLLKSVCRVCGQKNCPRHRFAATFVNFDIHFLLLCVYELT